MFVPVWVLWVGAAVVAAVLAPWAFAVLGGALKWVWTEVRAELGAGAAKRREADRRAVDEVAADWAARKP